jgi:hypothetical protein
VVGAAVEHGLKGVEGQGDIGGVLAGGVLVLQVGREGEAHQGLLPFVGEGAVVAVAPAQHHAAELGHHPQGEFENFRGGIVAVHQHRHPGFDGVCLNVHFTASLCVIVAPAGRLG